MARGIDITVGRASLTDAGRDASGAFLIASLSLVLPGVLVRGMERLTWAWNVGRPKGPIVQCRDGSWERMRFYPGS